MQKATITPTKTFHIHVDTINKTVTRQKIAENAGKREPLNEIVTQTNEISRRQIHGNKLNIASKTEIQSSRRKVNVILDIK